MPGKTDPLRCHPAGEWGSYQGGLHLTPVLPRSLSSLAPTVDRGVPLVKPGPLLLRRARTRLATLDCHQDDRKVHRCLDPLERLHTTARADGDAGLRISAVSPYSLEIVSTEPAGVVHGHVGARLQA
jgi:hypothetical protein